MANKKNLDFNLLHLAKAFDLHLTTECAHLKEWLASTFTFDAIAEKILHDTHASMMRYNEQMNEEELKIRLVAPLFYVANVDEKDKIMVFYERAMSAEVNGYALAVISDCMVATPVFNLPDKPYFFLQEFKKKKDPEAQMLTAMLIAQSQNELPGPVYGGYLIGTSWRFTTLVGREYCVSPILEASKKEDLYQIAFALKALKPLILKQTEPALF
jgi:hypothetical protein